MKSAPTSPEPEPPPLDVKRIVSTLDTHGVQYLLIGGLGATLYGAERVTQDIDLLPRTDSENLARLASAFRDPGAFLRVGGLSDEEARALPVVIDAKSLGATEVTTWRTEAGDLDVLATIRGEYGERRQFADLIDRSSETIVTGVTVRVAALQDIVESKRFAGREKDLEALPELERLLEQTD
ncbi:MAG: hypothetical protein HYX32_01835 [Actinobacteria bacterium]|nr:hypothetical protein [Actinomycetota bacterium]